MNSLQTYLRAGESIEHLTSEYGIYVKSHPNYPELLQFSYDQIESIKHKTHPLVITSRGIILNSKNWEVVAYPFDRFFNLGEVGAAEIDWKTARVQEKLDGSLMIMYWYDGKWNVATRNSPNAAGNVGDNPFTFAELFFKTATEQGILGTMWGEEFRLHRPYTYLFELTSQFNRVVCNHTEPKLHLIGIRDNLSGQEYQFDEFPPHPEFNQVKSFPLTSFEEIVESAKHLDPIHQEGYVVWDGKNRNKVKSPSYVALHHLVDGFSVRRIIDLIKNGESSELMAYYPDYKKLFDETQELLDNKAAWYDAEYVRMKDELFERCIEPASFGSKFIGYTRKDFAIEAMKASSYSSPFFALVDEKVKSSKEFFLKLPTQKLEELLYGQRNSRTDIKSDQV